MSVSPDAPSLRYVLERPSPFEDYVIGFVAASLGMSALRVEPGGGDPVLYRGESPPDGPRGIVVAPRAGDPIWPELLDGRLNATDMPAIVPFDLVGAIGSFLTDTVNASRGSEARDRHGRLHFEASFQAERGVAELPIVNVYVRALGELIARELGVQPRPIWPAGKRAAIGLSHDVDRPMKWGILRAFGSGRLPRPSGLPHFAAKTLYTGLQRIRSGSRDDYWLFDEILEAETARGFRSTFFFASMPAFGAWGTPNDVYYDIGWPRFTPVFRHLTDAGFGIGLHASFEAHRGVERFRVERERLAGLSGSDVPGLRHHFWHLGRFEAATLRMHEAAGFSYDASIAFNDHLGFRRNVALPYRPWDATLGRPLRTLQLPTFCMDGHLFYAGSSVDHALAELDRYLAAVKDCGGFGAIDWHVRTSIPANREFRHWGEAYLAILDHLAADDELWVTSLDEVAARAGRVDPNVA